MVEPKNEPLRTLVKKTLSKKYIVKKNHSLSTSRSHHEMEEKNQPKKGGQEKRK